MTNKRKKRESFIPGVSLLSCDYCPKLPPIEVPEIELDQPPKPFISSRMELHDHIRVMKTERTTVRRLSNTTRFRSVYSPLAKVTRWCGFPASRNDP